MFRDRLLEAKKAAGLSAKTMAEQSTLHTAEETITRILTGKIADPHVSTLMDLAAIVGLAPHELFMDAATSAEFRLFLEAKITNIDNSAELELLRIQNAENAQQIAKLQSELDHANCVIKHQEKTIKIYDHFIKIEE